MGIYVKLEKKEKIEIEVESQWAENISFCELNRLDSKKVEEIAISMQINGYSGTPIAYCNLGLLTGSHRLAAAKRLDIQIDMVDLTHQVNIYCKKNNYSYIDIDFAVINDMTITQIIKYLIA
jgi:hypothetical protein